MLPGVAVIVAANILVGSSVTHTTSYTFTTPNLTNVKDGKPGTGGKSEGKAAEKSEEDDEKVATKALSKSREERTEQSAREFPQAVNPSRPRPKRKFLRPRHFSIRTAGRG
jgi:hypothetical protein